MSRTVSNVEGFFRRLWEMVVNDDEAVFFRGHSNAKIFTLSPSLNRNTGHTENEQLLVNELLSSNPQDFRDDRSMFEKLVRMQHHSLPTRLLDITSNPLMALYFACCEFDNTPGEVVVIKIKKSLIKFSDSDTVSCLANVARLTSAERSQIDTTLNIDAFNESPPIGRLLHFIKEEKPYFAGRIDPAHVPSILCVRPKMSNERIASQSGAFLLFGLNAALPEEGTDDFKIERATISGSQKEKIRSELEILNIHRGTVYPNMENSALVIRERYKATAL